MVIPPTPGIALHLESGHRKIIQITNEERGTGGRGRHVVTAAKIRRGMPDTARSLALRELANLRGHISRNIENPINPPPISRTPDFAAEHFCKYEIDLLLER